MPNIVNEDVELKGYELDNFTTFVYYVMRLKSLATTMFKWNNLPESINPIFLENAFLWYCNIGWAVDDVTKELIALPMVLNGTLDIYGYPNGATLFGMNGYNLKVTKENSVFSYDNYNRMPIFRDLLMFAKRLANIDRAMDINIDGQKTPYVLSGDKTQIATLKQFYKAMVSNQPAIISDKNFDVSASIKCTPTVAPFVAGNLQIIKRNIWNEAMTFLGVENVNSEKKERLVTQEATGNMAGVKYSRNARLKPRQEAVELINKKFGTNIEVVANTELDIEMEDNDDYREDY